MKTNQNTQEVKNKMIKLCKRFQRQGQGHRNEQITCHASGYRHAQFECHSLNIVRDSTI